MTGIRDLDPRRTIVRGWRIITIAEENYMSLEPITVSRDLDAPVGDG